MRILWDELTGKSPQRYYEENHKRIEEIVDHINETNEKDAAKNSAPFAGGFGSAIGIGADARATGRALSNRSLASFAGFGGPNSRTYNGFSEDGGGGGGEFVEVEVGGGGNGGSGGEGFGTGGGEFGNGEYGNGAFDYEMSSVPGFELAPSNFRTYISSKNLFI